MKYVVMECHTSYAVVLADDGRFLNVANMHYEVGQTVNDVFEMQLPAPMPAKKKHTGRWITAITAVAACLLLLFTGVFQNLQMPYASVYLSINPSVRIDVKKDNKVIDIEGLNADGVQLIDGYIYDDKHLDLVTEELIDLAIQMGYLSDGGEIRLTFDADDDEWEIHTGQVLRGHINDMLTDKMSVTISLGDDDDEDEEFENVVIPITSDDNTGYSNDDYGDDTVSTGDNSGGNVNRPVSGDNGDSGYVQKPSGGGSSDGGNSSNGGTVSQPDDDGVTDYVPPVSDSGSDTNNGTGSDTGGDSGYTSSGDSNYSSSNGDSGYASSDGDSGYESSDDNDDDD